ncbi:MAG: aspartate aminotransferase family protein [Rickettsiales bacterium]|nr:aspartate aminotransferase family protein [Rickettsiales bacterium]
MNQNDKIFARALKVLPGGVNSPVRAFRAVGGTPLVLKEARGAQVVDAAGRNYLDFVGSWGPLILGHAHPEVVAAICEAAAKGTTYGAPCKDEVLLAEEVISAYPGIDQIRCVSSGTEAVMSAIRLARGATGRDGIVKFSGCYHGHSDALLVKAGSGLATFGVPSSAGIPADTTHPTRVLQLDDSAAITDLLRREGDDIAAVIIEPMPANNGLLLQRKQFLQTLRDETRKAGALLIFDEVISGFRIARGGAAERYGITPDLVTFGKVIGGGLPVGAFGGRADLMAHLAPLGAVYQAGTLSGNPLAMASGLATLKVLNRDHGWKQLEELGAHLDATLGKVLESSPAPARLIREGSVFWMSLQPGAAPRSAEAIEAEAAQRYSKLFHSLLKNGINIAPSAYEVGFLSLAHSRADIERLAATVEQSLSA